MAPQAGLTSIKGRLSQQGSTMSKHVAYHLGGLSFWYRNREPAPLFTLRGFLVFYKPEKKGDSFVEFFIGAV